MRALVIDDARVTRMILKAALSKLGYEVSEAGNGREGLEALARAGRPDVVLVDWHMPEMDGLAFVRAVRGGDHPGLPLVMVTAESDERLIGQARTAGADGLLAKPFTPEQVRDCLQGLGLGAARA